MKFKEYRKQRLQKDIRPRRSKQRDLAFDLGLLVLEARIRKGLTQEELAAKIGTYQSSIARVESGEVEASSSFLRKIADALGEQFVPPHFNFDDTGSLFIELTKDGLEVETTRTNSKPVFDSNSGIQLVQKS